MTSPDFDTTLRAALAAPMTAIQRASLDARLERRLAPGSRRRLHVRPRTIAAAFALLLLAAPMIFPVSALLRTTESPLGLESAAAFQGEIDAAKKVVPLPAGATWPPSLVARDGTYSAGGARSWVEMVAFCAWDRSWLDATTSGPSGRAQAARSVILSTPTWEFYRGQFSTDSSRAAIDRIVAAVRDNDTSIVAGFVQLNCPE